MAKNNDNIDINTLMALAQILKAKGKIDRIDMESKTFREMLVKEMKAMGAEFFDELGEWGKTTGKELGAWGDAFSNLLP